MDKKIKLGIISASALTFLCVAGGVYYRIQQLEQKRDYFQSKFDKTKAMLPKAISIEKTSESHLFETNSQYVIQLVQNGKKSSSKLIINAHLKHNLSYLFSGVVTGYATGKFEGPFTKEFVSLDKLFDSQIKILPDDTLVTDTKFADLVAKDGTEIKGITSFFESTKNNENIKTNFNIASLSSPKQDGKPGLFKLSNLNIEYNGKSNQIGNNHFGFKIDDIQSPFANINHIVLNADSTVKSGSVDIKSSLNIGKINAAKWKNGSINFQYSFLGINEQAIRVLYDIGQKTAPSNEEDVKKQIVSMEEQVKKIITHGFQLNIDKLSFKSGKDTFNLSLKSSLPHHSQPEEVSFEKNLKLSYSLNMKSDLSPIVAEQINKKLQSFNNDPTLIQEPQITVTNNELQVHFDINNGKGTLNDKNLTPEQQDILHIILSTFDEKFHLKADLNTPPVETVKDSSSEIQKNTLENIKK